MKQTGIYGLQNKFNGKWYVGQSVDIEGRWREYKSIRCRSQPKLYNALLKHGYEGFERVLLEECTLEQLPEREEYWVKEKNSVKNGYNCKSGGFKGGKHSDETKEKLRLSKLGKPNSPECIAKQKLYRATDETKEKISKSLLGNQFRKGIPSTDREKERLSKFFSEIPRTDEWRANIAKSATWVGKVSAEARKRGDDKRRGVPRPIEMVARMSATKTGTKRKYLPDGSFVMVKPQALQ
jgi:group I intron endonuclease